jgi:hypothetical protein
VPGFLEAHGYGPGGKRQPANREVAGDVWQEKELGLKRLTPENWLKPDTVMRFFGRLPDVGEPYVPSGEERARDVMGIEMAEEVPPEVRRLFAAVKGALCYGYFFHPLLSLVSEQLSRVAEAADARKYEAVGEPRRVRKTLECEPRNASFQDRLDYLKRGGLITERDAVWWGAIREHRGCGLRHSCVTSFVAMRASVHPSLRLVTEDRFILEPVGAFQLWNLPEFALLEAFKSRFVRLPVGYRFPVPPGPQHRLGEVVSHSSVPPLSKLSIGTCLFGAAAS